MDAEINKLQEFEKMYKGNVYRRIDNIISAQKKKIRDMRSIEEFLGINADIPNIGITLNNKVIEISHIFKDSGLSLFSEEYDKAKDSVASSFLGDAILDDLIMETYKAFDKYKEYSEILLENADQNLEMLDKTYMSSNWLRKVLFRIKCFFNPEMVDEIRVISDDQRAIANAALEGYRNCDNYIWEYSLQEHIVTAVANYMINNGYSDKRISSILSKSIIPNMSKLNLGELSKRIESEIRIRKKEKLNSMKQLELKSPTDKPWILSDEQKQQVILRVPDDCKCIEEEKIQER